LFDGENVVSPALAFESRWLAGFRSSPLNVLCCAKEKKSGRALKYTCLVTKGRNPRDRQGLDADLSMIVLSCGTHCGVVFD
jgi:hypothetical protein